MKTTEPLPPEDLSKKISDLIAATKKLKTDPADGIKTACLSFGSDSRKGYEHGFLYDQGWLDKCNSLCQELYAHGVDKEKITEADIKEYIFKQAKTEDSDQVPIDHIEAIKKPPEGWLVYLPSNALSLSGIQHFDFCDTLRCLQPQHADCPSTKEINCACVFQVTTSSTRDAAPRNAHYLIDVGISLLRLWTEQRLLDPLQEREPVSRTTGQEIEQYIVCKPGEQPPPFASSRKLWYVVDDKAQKIFADNKAKCDQILEAEEEETLAKRVQRALHFLTRGRCAIDLPSKFLFYFIAIETIFDAETRDLDNWVRNIYKDIGDFITVARKLRNPLVHKGHRMISESECRKLGHHAHNLCKKVIENYNLSQIVYAKEPKSIEPGKWKRQTT